MTYRIVPERSQLRAEARATLHSVRVQTSGFEGFVEAEVENGQARLLLPIHVELSVARLTSGNALLDGELQHRLEGRKFPKVIGEAREITPLENSRFRVRADLTLHGVTRSFQVQAAVKILREKLHDGPVTLLYAARDVEHNNAVALKAWLEDHG